MITSLSQYNKLGFVRRLSLCFIKKKKMNSDSFITIEKINEGDIYYFNLNKRYFVFQVLKIVTDLPAPYDINYKYGYYIAVFKKTFKDIPKSKNLDLKRVFVDKYYRKNTAGYFSIWNNKEPSIKCKNSNLKKYKLKAKPEFTYLENRPVDDFKKFNPPLLPLFSMGGGEPIYVEDYPNGISNYPEVIISIDQVLIQILEEEKSRNKKNEKINPIFFPDWLDYIDGTALLKTEKAISIFELKEGSKRVKENALKKCIEKLNMIDEKLSHIGTIEREDIIEKLMEIATLKEITEDVADNIIEENRDW